MQKLGIKCEIHDCTIEICKFLENMGIIKIGISVILERDKELRIDNQYYLKNIAIAVNMAEIREFVLYFKDRLTTLTFDEVEKARKELKNILK